MWAYLHHFIPHGNFKYPFTLYCVCLNPECAHSFVSTLAYSHTLSPSAFDLPKPIREKLRKTNSRKQVQLLFEGMA